MFSTNTWHIYVWDALFQIYYCLTKMSYNYEECNMYGEKNIGYMSIIIYLYAYYSTFALQC